MFRGLYRRYPYSTRELVATVNHLQRFPSEGIQSVLRNIFDFDGYDEDVQVGTAVLMISIFCVSV